MKKIPYIPATLIAVAILAACTTPHNSTLTVAHSDFDSARGNPQITNLAAAELKDAGDSLNKADSALSKGESADKVDHLSYIADQQVAIARETAKRKAAEAAVANAAGKRDQVRLEARTAEADASKKQVADMQETANSQSAEIAAQDANAVDDQVLIAQQEMQLKLLNAKKTNRGLVITLGDVLFGRNRSEIKSGGTRNLQKLAEFLREYPKRTVLIEGYTDSTGTDSYNQSLSERRANAVRTALLDDGVNGDRISTRGYGKRFPVADNNTASSRQLNRRVEIIFSDDHGNIAPR